MYKGSFTGAIFIRRTDACELEWISYECSDEGTCTPNIRNSSTRSHALEGGSRSRNHSSEGVRK